MGSGGRSSRKGELPGGRIKKQGDLAVGGAAPVDVREAGGGHAGDVGDLGRCILAGIGERAVDFAGAIDVAEAFVAERYLIGDGDAPGRFDGEFGEAAVDGEGVGNVTGLEEVVGELIAGAALPVAPALGIGGGAGAFGAQEVERGGERFLGAVEFAQRGGEEEAGFGDVFVVGPLFEVGAERGDGAVVILGKLEGVAGFEMCAGAIGRGEIEHAEAREELVGLGELAGLEMGFGDFELCGLGEELVVFEAGVGGELQRGVDDVVEAGDREAGRAHVAERATEIEQGVGHADVGRVVLQVAFVDRGGLGELALLAVHTREAEESGLGLLERSIAVEDLPVGDFGGVEVVAFGEVGAEIDEALSFARGETEGEGGLRGSGRRGFRVR